MSVRKEPSGRRSVQVEVEVPGTPEEVWDAIATGPGVSSWFVPTEIEGRAGGSITSNFGPGMVSKGVVNEWQPPHRFTKESPGAKAEAPPLATEWIVEAQDGDTCIVRVVHSLFASNEDWDNQLTGAESGWPAFFRILRLYLTHFRGQTAAQIQAMAIASKPVAEVWAALSQMLGFGGAAAGQRVEASEPAPSFAGTVESNAGDAHTALVRLTEPSPGIASLVAVEMGGKSYVAVSLYFYGPQAAATVELYKAQWSQWITQQFSAS